MSSQATEKKKDFVGTIAAVVMSMGAIFAVLQAILPTGLTPAIATLALGLVLTGALVWANFLSLQTAGLTWAGTSIVLVIVHLIISRPATINGYVIDVNGNPVVGQALVLNDSSGVDHRVITDNAGRFEIRNVPEGRYTLITDAGKLLLAGEVSPGWKRFVSPKVEVGSLPISLANLSNPTATPEVAMLPSDMPPATSMFTPPWTAEFTWTPTPRSTSTPMATTISTETPSASAPRQIAFSSDRDGNTEIYVMNLDGSNPHNLTNNSAWDAEPDWSPDGSQVAFVSDRDGNYEIYAMNADGSNPRNLTNNDATDDFPAWSPDGSQIAFVSDRGNGDKEIYAMNADGSNLRNLTNNSAEDVFPTWSPDGSQIAFQSNRDGIKEIYVMNADGSNPYRLTNTGAEDMFPAWSPDGGQIAFEPYRNSKGEIYVINVDGSNLRNLTNNSADDWDPAWSPDSSQIAFTSDRDGNSEIYVINVDGSNLRNLTSNSAWDVFPAWQPVSLSPTSIPAGRMLFSEDFEDDKADGLLESVGGNQLVIINDGTGNRVWRGTGGFWFDLSTSSSSQWTDYALEFRFKANGYIPNDNNLNVGVRSLPGETGCIGYILGLSSDYSGMWTFLSGCELESTEAGDNEPIAHSRLSSDSWHTVYLEVMGNNIRWRIDDGPLYAVTDSTYLKGTAGIGFGADNVEIWFDDIHVWQLE